MNSIKVPLEHLFGFLVSIIPGSVALFVMHIHHPEFINQIWLNGNLGYQTKLVLTALASFLLGWTLSFNFRIYLGAIGGAIGGIVGTARSKQKEDPHTPKPWRSAIWRTLLSSYLGKASPENIDFIEDATVKYRMDLASSLPEPDRTKTTNIISSEKLKSNLNDLQWQSWWDHLHQSIFFKPPDPVAKLEETLRHDFQVASMVILVSMIFTPILRSWWLFAISLAWLFQLVFDLLLAISSIYNPWLSFNRQLDFLREQISAGQSPGSIETTGLQ